MDSVAPPFQPGTLIGAGRYRIEAILGRGGADTVYSAIQVALHDQVAIKVSAAVDSGSLEALREEARLLRGLRHAHLPLVIDFFVEGPWPCLVLEFIDGQDLEQLRAARGGVLAEPEAARWIGEVAAALAFLHTRPQPVVHRDVKPANVRIDRRGKAILVDFGIAKVGGPGTQTRLMAKGVGTPPYAPPEQYGDAPTGAYSDVYALGATFYVLLTGQRPPESVTRQAGAPLVSPRRIDPRISLHAEQIILKAMALPHSERFASARELLEALHTAVSIGAQEVLPVDAPVGPQVAKTEALGAYRTCPRCSYAENSGNAAFCLRCGTPIALRFPQTGRLVRLAGELAEACATDWDAAVEHVRSGRLEQWLEARSETQLLEQLHQALARCPDDPALALDLLFRPHPLADLVADRQFVDLGSWRPDSRPALALPLRLGAPGYLAGSVRATGDWLIVTPAALNVPPGQPIPPIRLSVRPEAMGSGDVDRTYTSTITIVTNRGTLELPARLVVHNPPQPEVPAILSLGVVDARQRIDKKVSLRNIGGGAISGQVSARYPWLMVEAQQAQFVLHRGEQHTVSFSVDSRLLSPSGDHEGALLWETDHGDLLTRVQVTVVPPYDVSPHDQATAIGKLEDLVPLCDCLRGAPPYAWERGLALLRGGKLAAACRFFRRDELALEAERLAHLGDINLGLEQLLRQLGAKPARRFRDNQHMVLSQITGPLSRKPAEIVYGVLNTSKRGYLHGTVRPLVDWIAIPEPAIGCLPDQEAVVRLYPDYGRRARLGLFEKVSLFEVILG